MVGTLLLRSLVDRQLRIGHEGLRCSAAFGGTGPGGRSTNWSLNGTRQRRGGNNDRQEKSASLPSDSTLLLLLGERGGGLSLLHNALSTARTRTNGDRVRATRLGLRVRFDALRMEFR